MVPAVHIKRVPGNEPRGIVRQKRRCHAYVVDADETAGAGLGFCLFEELVELRYTGCRARGKRPWRNGVDPYPLGTELRRNVAHCTFERRLGDAHNVEFSTTMWLP